MSFLPYVVAAWLLLIGLYGVVSSTNLIRTVLSLTIVQSSTYLVLLGVGYRTGGKAPIVADIPTSSKLVDPVVQVLVLTDVVIEAPVTALLVSPPTRRIGRSPTGSVAGRHATAWRSGSRCRSIPSAPAWPRSPQ